MIVLDASVLVSAVLDSGADGAWALSVASRGDLIAPSHLLVETHNVLRRLERAGTESAAVGMARAHVVRLPIEFVPFEAIADRVWDLRGSMTAYDAAYVAVAEMIASPLATLDRRLARAPGARCEFLLPS